MKIVFTVNTTGLTGGIKVIFEYANRLQARGHEVLIVYPYNLTDQDFPHLPGWIAILKRIKFLLYPNITWFKLAVPVKRVPRLTDQYLPDADIVIATANETADFVAKLNRSKGEKFYFIQGFETWSRKPSLVEATWHLPLKKIVIANWLKDQALALNEAVSAVIPNGIDSKQFFPSPKPQTNPPVIFALLHPLPIKGTADLITALKRLQTQGEAFKLVGFSAYPLQKLLKEFPHLGSIDLEFHYKPEIDQLRQLYSDAEVFVSPSHSEGFPLTPMEAMACQTAVVATAVGGILDYAEDQKTTLLVPPKQPEQLARAIKTLLKDSNLRSKLAKQAYNRIQDYIWDKSVQKFEQTLLESVAQLHPKLPKQVDCIIVNFQTFELTNRAIESVLKEPELNQVIVVDNHSQDDSPPKLKAVWGDHPQVKLIFSDQNVGFGMGNNLGLKQATAPYIFLLNSDAEVVPGCLKILLEELAQNPQIGLAAPQILCPDGQEQRDAQGYFPTALRILSQKSGQFDLSDHPDWLSGVSLIIRRLDFLSIGGFDPDYFMYFEDIDLSWRVRQQGWQLAKVRQAQVIHQGGSSFKKQTTRQKKQIYYQAQELYLTKCGTSLPLRFLLALVRFGVTGIWVQPRTDRVEKAL